MDLIPNWVMQVGIVIVGAGYIITQWRNGGGKATSDVILAYKEKTELQDKKITELTEKMGKMQGILEEKDKRIELLTRIVENRNPEMEAFIKNQSEVALKANNFMENSTKILSNIETFMSHMEPALTKLASN